MLKEWWLTWSSFGDGTIYLALTPIYQSEALLASPNQDKSLRLTCYSIYGFPNSIYEYEQSYINYNDLWLWFSLW